MKFFKDSLILAKKICFTEVKVTHFKSFVFVMLTFLLFFSLFTQEQEKIIETVRVRNIEIPVRVFKGTQLVGGLTKKDFILYVNGKKKEINGFFEIRKKLEVNPPNIPSQEIKKINRPRFFTLIFNINDYHQELKSLIEFFFNNIIQPNDRIMAITNHYVFPEWVVESPEKTKNEIIDIIKKERRRVKFEMLRFQSELKAEASLLKARMADKEGQDNPDMVFRHFFLIYQFVLEDIKNNCLNLPLEEYVKIAEYMRAQEGDKWVLNFYQIGHLPLLDSFGQVSKILTSLMDSTMRSVGGGSSGFNSDDAISLANAIKNVKTVYFDFLQQLRQVDHILIKDISKSFLNSGATFHTLLLKPINPGFSDDFKYEPVNTDSESILRSLSRMTGGSITRSNRINDFINDITEKEDIIYYLTFIPGLSKKKYLDVKIKIKDGEYTVSYDNHKRLNMYRRVMKELDLNKSDLEIKSISYNNDHLTVKLSNIIMADYEGKRFGAVQVRFKILDHSSRLISNFKKTYKGIEEEGIFITKLPLLPPGNYKVVLEIKDLFSLKNVFVGDAINIIKKQGDP